MSTLWRPRSYISPAKREVDGNEPMQRRLSAQDFKGNYKDETVIDRRHSFGDLKCSFLTPRLRNMGASPRLTSCAEMGNSGQNHGRPLLTVNNHGNDTEPINRRPITMTKSSNAGHFMIHLPLGNTRHHLNTFYSSPSNARQTNKNEKVLFGQGDVGQKKLVNNVKPTYKNVDKQHLTKSHYYETQTNLGNNKMFTFEDKFVAPKQDWPRIGMSISVNGMSKSMNAWKMPYQNRSLDNGDFGDDAGMMFENNNCCFIALADGAGGNRSQGIDPSIFSRNLMASCLRVLRSSEYNTRQLLQLVTAAMKKIEMLNVLGSATICVVGLDRRMNLLNTLNIGDSGVKVIRSSKIVFRSKRTMNGSTPCQLFLIDHTDLFKMGVLPTSFIKESEIRADSAMQSIPVQVGDIIIISSDGLWDVISENSLLKIIETSRKRGNVGVADISDALLHSAIKAYNGGSRDDILIIVARIKSSN
ncbi:hypothetical protein ACOME3_009037 [Neoechinorhynchus agilis]